MITTIRRTKLAVMTGALLLIAALSRGQAQIERPKLEVSGFGVPFAERLGQDDGFQLAVHFSGDTRGSLDPCG